MKARRTILAELSHQPTSHAGLWLDRYLREQTQDGTGSEGVGEKAALIRDVEGQPAPAGYRAAFERWRRLLEVEGERIRFAEAETSGRLVVGLGSKGALEAGLHLDHTWGIPVLPGTALKGLAAATAHQLTAVGSGWRRDEESHRFLFGSTDEAGAVSFLDAWWVPADTVPIHLDVMTVHHREYYQNGTAPPADTDSPIPVPFASVSGRFLIAVEGDAAWTDAAMSFMQQGLTELGLGAKTGAGYGRMKLTYRTQAETDKDRQHARQRALADLRQQAAGIQTSNADFLVPALLEALHRLGPEADAETQMILSGLVQRLTRKTLQAKPKPWSQRLLALVPEEPRQRDMPAPATAEWAVGMAWIVRDEKNRAVVHVRLEGGGTAKGHLFSIERGTGVDEELSRASEAAPVNLRYQLKGKKLSRLRRSVLVSP